MCIIFLGRIFLPLFDLHSWFSKYVAKPIVDAIHSLRIPMFLFYINMTSLTLCPADPQTKLLRKAESLLVKEKEQKSIERESALRERAPPLKLSGLSAQELQVQKLTTCYMFSMQCFFMPTYYFMNV